MKVVNRSIRLTISFLRSRRFIILPLLLILLVQNDSSAQCSPASTSFPLSEGFNNVLGDWTQGVGDDMNWTLRSGSTPSGNTGPSGAQESTHYIYIEASGSGHPTKVADLISPCFSMLAGVQTTISFYYHMYGGSMGSLDLQISNDDGASWTSLWLVSGDQGNQWNYQVVNINAFIGDDGQLRFHGITGTGAGSWQSDIAIDNVVIDIGNPLEICDDGIDNDNDGDIDCADIDCGEILNRQFDNGLDDWDVWNDTGNASTLSVDNSGQLSGTNSGNIDITLSSGDDWRIALYQDNHSIIDGHTYTIYFDAKAESAKNISVELSLGEAPWTTYFYQSVALSTLPQSFQYTFTTNATSNNVTFSFGLGDDDTNVWIDNVQFKEECSVDPTVSASNAGESCIGTFANLSAVANPDNVDTWSWTGPDGFSSSFQNPSFQVTSMVQTGTYTVTALFNDGFSASASTVFSVDEDCSDVCASVIQVEPTNPTKCDTLNGNIYVTEYGNNFYENSINGITWNPSQYTYSNLGVGEYLIRLREVGTTLVCRTVNITLVVINNPWYSGETVTNSTSCLATNGAIQLAGVLPTDEVTWVHGSGWTMISDLPVANTITNLKAGKYYVRVRRGNNIYCYTERIVDITHTGIPCPEWNLCDPSAGNIDHYPEGEFGTGALPAGPPLSLSETQYGYAPMNCVSPSEGFYSIINRTDCDGSGGQILGAFDVLAEDHTDADVNGYMLLINASSNPDIAIQRLVSGLETNTYYNFSTWIYNIQPSAPLKPNLTFLVDGVGEYITGDILDTGWTLVGFPFYTGNKTSVTLAIRNNQTGGLGNDWILDDIAVSVCKPDIIVSDVDICEDGSGLVLSAQVTDPASQFDLYKWQVYDTATTTWNDVSPLINGSYTGTLMQADYTLPGNIPLSSHGNKYRIKVTTSVGNINDVEFSNTSDDVILTVNENPVASMDYNGSVCLGVNSQLTANATGGSGTNTYLWSGPNGYTENTEVASISENGNYYLTITDSNGCTGTASGFVHAAYEPTIVSLQSEVCSGESIDLEVNSASATGYLWSANAGSDTSAIVTVFPDVPSSTYTVTVTNDVNCTSVVSITISAENCCDDVILAGEHNMCQGETNTLTASTGAGIWTSSDVSIATIDNNGIVNALSAGTVVMSYDNDVIVCDVTPTFEIIVGDIPTITTGDTLLCVGDNAFMQPAFGGIWTSSDDAIATITNSGIVLGVSAGTVTFTYTDSWSGCSSLVSDQVTITDQPMASIDFSGGLCLTDTSELSVSYTGGTEPFTYNWTGPNSLSESTQEITITDNGNYYVTITDAKGCTANTSGFVYAEFTAFIINLQSEVCEGDTIQLSATGAAGTTYLWSANAQNATTPSVAVVPQFPSSTYYVTITNDLGCSVVATAEVDVLEAPSISLVGPDEICIGETTTLSPSADGIWSSSVPSVAIVSFDGTVTGISDGISSFTFTENINGCESTDSIEITINEIPNVGFIGSDQLCIGETTTLSPPTGGSWVSSDPSIATITDGGVATAVYEGVANFIFTNTASGCTATTTQGLTVQNNSVATLDVSAPLCTGGTTTASPTTGGLWVSSDDNIATIANTGLITGVAVGKVIFTYTSLSTGCGSVSTDSLTIGDPPTVFITGATTVCIGDNTTLSPPIGGSWTSEDPQVATVNNFGIVTSLTSGTTRFRFTDAITGCISDYTNIVTVNTSPDIQLLGNSSICIGEQTFLSPISGGTWVSDNAQIATIASNGTITGLIAGSVTFTFTDTATGCTAISAPIIVNNLPDVMLSGPSTICLGTSTNLLPSNGGVWTSSDNSLATVSANGIVLGLSPGTVSFTYTESASGCPSSDSLNITILDQPQTQLIGSNTICEGFTTSLLPNTGGDWTSNNTSVASITASGLVTGIGQGVARFTFTSDAGCSSSQSAPVIVYGKPQIFLENENNTCIGSSIHILPSTGGTWTSSDATIASITDGGEITGMSQGLVIFVFTDTITGCVSEASEIVSILTDPIVSIIGPSDICIGSITNLSPSVGGFWESSDPMVASVDNTGRVTGISGGIVTFDFTSATTGCTSSSTDPIAVDPGPAISYTGSDNICIGFTSSLSPTSGGTWTSTDVNVATVTDNGIITAVGQGTTRFRFVDATTGCSSVLSGSFTVHDTPTISYTGPQDICIGNTTQLSPTTGGTWSSSDVSIAIVDNTGLVTGVSQGEVEFLFTDISTGCVSSDTLRSEVVAPPLVAITGITNICIGSHTTLTPTTGGIWTSSNPDIATVSNEGVVLGKAAGEVTFTFTNVSTGCTVDNVTNPIIVDKCINHDFNVTSTGVIINSSIATNDDYPVGTVYNSSYTTISKPSASSFSLDINADGGYVFSANAGGKYLFSIPVCIPPSIYGCTSSLLEITVVSDIFLNAFPTVNLDMSTTYAHANEALAGYPVLMESILNDHCIKVTGCTLDAANLNVSTDPDYGTYVIDALGDVTYTPEVGFIGADVLSYSICLASAPTECATTDHYINVNHASAINNLYTNDDFNWMMKDSTATGNVKENDGDAEGDILTISPMGSDMSPINILGGSYYIESNGDYTFVPDADFSGYTEIKYTICDDNVNVKCKDATIHLLVFDDLHLDLKVYLEGALLYNNGELTSSGDPLMRDDLRSTPYDGLNYIPTHDPYISSGTAVLNFTQNYHHKGPGLLTDFQIVNDSSGVFAVTGEEAIVDWVFVEVRSKDDMTYVLGTRSGLVQRDGDIVDLDGTSSLRFRGVTADSFYVVVKHRLHLGVMSGLVGNGSLVDFTDPQTEVFNYGTTLQNSVDYTGLSQNSIVKSGYCALWAGDFNSDGKVKFTNPDDDLNWLFFEVLLVPENTEQNINYNFAYGYYNGDYDMDGRAKYTNPSDDTNLIFFQMLQYNLNTEYFANYSFFKEQVPR